MKKHVPNFITCLNILTGAIGTLVVVSEQDASLAFGFVVLAGLFDFLDGLAARLLGVQSEIGKQLDSLADVVSFGVLPSVALTLGIGDALTSGLLDFRVLPPAAFVGTLVVAFSALRLAKFNLATDQSDEFRGLPTPANALMLTSFFYVEAEYLSAAFLITLTLVSCGLLVSNVRMVAFKFKKMQWEGNEVRFSLLGILVAGFAIFQLSFLPFVIPAYIGASILGNYLVFRRVS